MSSHPVYRLPFTFYQALGASRRVNEKRSWWLNYKDHQAHKELEFKIVDSRLQSAKYSSFDLSESTICNLKSQITLVLFVPFVVQATVVI